MILGQYINGHAASLAFITMHAYHPKESIAFCRFLMFIKLSSEI